MRKLVSTLLVFLSASSFSLTAEAEDFLKNSSFTIGPEYVNVHLHVDATSTAGSMKLNGNAWGGTAAYEYKEADGVYLNLNGYYVSGHLNGNNEHRNFSDQRLEFRIGHIFVMDCCKKWKLIPYTGAGFAKIVQSHIAPVVAGGPYLTTKAPTYYVPVGFILSYQVEDCFQIATNVKWTPQVDATLSTSAIKHGRWTLRDKDGWVIEVPAVYREKICDVDASITLAPYWRILTKGTGTAVTAAGQSVPIAGLTYNFFGVKMLFGLSF